MCLSKYMGRNSDEDSSSLVKRMYFVLTYDTYVGIHMCWHILLVLLCCATQIKHMRWDIIYTNTAISCDMYVYTYIYTHTHMHMSCVLCRYVHVCKYTVLAGPTVSAYLFVYMFNAYVYKYIHIYRYNTYLYLYASNDPLVSATDGYVWWKYRSLLQKSPTKETCILQKRSICIQRSTWFS